MALLTGAVDPNGIMQRKFGMGAMVAIIVFASSAVTADDRALEYAVKAAYLSKFAPFVTWPLATTQKPTFDLCLSGTDDVTKLVPEATEGQSVNGKPLAVRVLAAGQSADTCQILYVASSPAASQVLDAERNKPVLTVSDAATGHAIVGFVVDQHHVRFDIDNGLATGAGLSISSKLLSLAHTVKPGLGDAR